MTGAHYILELEKLIELLERDLARLRDTLAAVPDPELDADTRARTAELGGKWIAIRGAIQEIAKVRDAWQAGHPAFRATEVALAADLADQAGSSASQAS